MFDINEEKGTHYITMEYVSGQDLKGLIRQIGAIGLWALQYQLPNKSVKDCQKPIRQGLSIET